MKCTKKHDHVKMFFCQSKPIVFLLFAVAIAKTPSCCHPEILLPWQGAKKIVFTACHSGKLKLAFTSPDVISTSPKNFLTSRIDFTVLLLFKFLKKPHFPIGQVKNRIHHPDSKIHQPLAIGQYFLCTLHGNMTSHFSSLLIFYFKQICKILQIIQSILKQMIC